MPIIWVVKLGDFFYTIPHHFGFASPITRECKDLFWNGWWLLFQDNDMLFAKPETMLIAEILDFSLFYLQTAVLCQFHTLRWPNGMCLYIWLPYLQILPSI